MAIDADRVRLRVRADDTGAKRTIAVEGTQLVARLLQHVLPPGFKRIRHYGLLAPAAKTQRLALARQPLAMPAANPQAHEDTQAFMRRVAAIEIECCSHCKIGRLRVLQQLAADRPALAAVTPHRMPRAAAVTRTHILMPAARSRRARRPGSQRADHSAALRAVQQSNHATGPTIPRAPSQPLGCHSKLVAPHLIVTRASR